MPFSPSALSASSPWWKLLHYKRDAFGYVESQVDGPLFFLDPRGKWDPEAELQADLAALSDTVEKGDRHFACRFPARARWLRSRAGAPEPASAPDCRAYEDFKANLSADSVSLVFASSYINSPPSAFGHVYLKLHHTRRAATLGLADYTVGFGARLDGAGPIRVVYAGFLGLFKGYYTVVPFDAGVRKYAYIDKRDQWVFPLAFKSAEVERLVDHLWELRPSFIYYAFLTENCAYHIGSLLEASRFDLELNRSPITTPLSLLHEMHTTGLTAGRLVPSVKSTLAFQTDALAAPEKRALRALVGSGYDLKSTALPGLGDTSRARVFDLASLHMDYRYGTDWVRDSLLHGRKLELMQARAELPGYVAVTPPAGSPPTLSHRAGRVESGYRTTVSRRPGESESGFYLTAMPAFHGRTDAVTGLGETSEFKVFELGLAYLPQARAARFERFVLLDLFNFEPSSLLLSNLDWKVTLGVENGYGFQQAAGPLNADLLLGFGRSLSESARNHGILYGLVTGGAKWYFENAEGDPFAGLLLGAVAAPTSRARVSLEMDARAYYARAGVRKDLALRYPFNATPNYGVTIFGATDRFDGKALRVGAGALGHF